MIDRLTSLRWFVRVAHAGCFSKASVHLGVSQPAVSRAIALLEQQLGVRLFSRTTRALKLTDAGAEFLARIEPLLAEFDELEHAVRGDGALRGRLRVGLSSSFGRREVIPRLPAFLERHPHLSVDLEITDQRQDLVSGGIDVAIRIGALEDSGATFRTIGRSPRIVIASPAYLARHGTPRTPAELSAHALVIGPGNRDRTVWNFQRDGDRVAVQVNGRVRVTSNEGATAAAVVGLGVTLTSAWGCRAELESGEVRTILDEWALQPIEAHAVFPDGRNAKPAARQFADYLERALSDADAQSASPG